jgi:hypothetical protein
MSGNCLHKARASESAYIAHAFWSFVQVSMEYSVYLDLSNWHRHPAKAAITSGDMDGRKMDWIRKQLGMTKVQFHKELGISRMYLFRCLRDGPPRTIELAVLGLWYSRKMSDILEPPQSPSETEPVPKSRRRNK